MGLILGAVSFAHCLGMCGGFAVYLSRGQTRSGILTRQLLWSSGKTVTYMFLGSLAGFFGTPKTFQNVLLYLTAGVMILMGLNLLGVIPVKAFSSQKSEEGLFSSLFQNFFSQPGSTSAFVLGLANGFLPCPIVLAALALAVKSSSVINGIAVMAGLGFGTIWSLLLLGMTGAMLNIKFRKWGIAISGIILILMGSAILVKRSFGMQPTCTCSQNMSMEH